MNISRNLRGSALIKYKKGLRLTQEQKDIIIGTLLGDASMRLSSNIPVYAIKFEQGIKNKEYIEHLYKVFEPYCGTGPKKRFIDRAQTREAIGFSTYRHDNFIFYYNFFYRIQEVSSSPSSSPSRQTLTKKGVKIIPKEIHKFLTPRAVAYWFMDDGTYHVDIKSGKRIYLFSTQRFQKTECQRLCDALKTNFNIDSNVHKDKDKWRIYVLASSSQKLINMIQPYIHSDFLYKL